MLDASLAVLGVCAQDDFGVTPRPESVALRLELRPEAAEVVDLAVEDDHERSRRVGHRLRSRAEVDDRESRHPEGDPAVGPRARVVGPTMREERQHRRHDLGRRVADPAGDTAHQAAVLIALSFSQKAPAWRLRLRSEEHTSELQSPYDLVCRLLLE